LLDTLKLSASALGQTLAGRNLNEVLQTLHARNPHLTAQQRAAIQDLSYGALRFYGRYDALLNLLVSRPLSDEAVHDLLVVALHQLRNPKAAPHAVVDHAVKVTLALKKTWAKGLVNAVLRNFLRQRVSLLEKVDAAGSVARYSHPQWWIDKLRAEYPDIWQDLLEQNNTHPPMTLRVNRRKAEVNAYRTALLAGGMEAEQIGDVALQLRQPTSVSRLPGFADGWASVQDAGAQLAAPLLDVQNGMRVLDACAAPGGKSAHLLELADIDLTALDSDATRLEKVAANLQRLGLNARCLCGDAGVVETWWDGQPYQRILADVPCSASGVVRRHPDIKWLRRPEDIGGFAAQQAKILDALWRLLASGGKLLYATCSLFAEENQLQINSFLASHKDATILPLALAEHREGQVLPDEHHDGFYYALLQKH